MARPKKADHLALKNKVFVRLTDSDLAVLQEKSLLEDLAMGQVIRHALVSAGVLPARKVTTSEA